MADPNPFRTPVDKIAHGRLYEPRAAKSLGARLTPNSGAMTSAKGDMQTADFLFESKTTVDSSLSVKLSWLVKISEEAQAKAKKPGLIIGFVMPDGRPKPNCESEWVCMPMQVFKELIGD